MASIPVNTKLRQGGVFALVLACASALPALSGQSMVPEAANSPGWLAGSALAKGSAAGNLAVPAWSAVPLGPEPNPSWEWLPTGPGRAPSWSPPAAPVINNAPLWKGL
jgi:hypothetical protein